MLHYVTLRYVVVFVYVNIQTFENKKKSQKNNTRKVPGKNEEKPGSACQPFKQSVEKVGCHSVGS